MRLNVQKPSKIMIGYVGENFSQEVIFNYSAWANIYGEGTLTLALKRFGDSTAYPVFLSHDSEKHEATWNVTTADVAKDGKGEAQLSYTVDSVIKKSSVFPIKVDRSIEQGETPPEPLQEWFDEVIGAGTQAVASATQAKESADNAKESEEKAKEYAESTYTKEELDELLSEKASTEALEELSEQLDSKADSSSVYTKTETDTLLSAKASASDLEALEEEMTDYRQMYLDSLIHTTASGSIASFSDGADGLPMDFCTATIEPKQEGSGDPSPTNVRPISGWTGAEVVRCGRNLFNPNTSENYWVGTNGSYSSHVGSKSVTLKVEEGEAYTLSLENVRTTTNIGCIAFYDLNDANLLRTITPNNGKAVTGTAPIGSVKMIASCYTYSEAGDVQLELGSTASDFEPYTADTYTVTWESEAGTVYGGSVDLVSGVLTVDKAMYLADGSVTVNNVNRHDSGLYYTIVTSNLGSKKTNPFLISNQFKPRSSVAIGNCYITGFGKVVVAVLPDQSITTKADATQWFADNPTQFVYELATPQTYQLTPQEITTLLGSNNVWSDTGAIACGYVANTKLYIDSRI